MEAMPPLADPEISAALEALAGWTREGDEIVKIFDCGSFAAAIAFVVNVGFIAERADHHPDILIHGWNNVRLTLSTHSAGAVTDADHALAGRIDALLGD